jgi:hypothetical protein
VLVERERHAYVFFAFLPSLQLYPVLANKMQTIARVVAPMMQRRAFCVTRPVLAGGGRGFMAFLKAETGKEQYKGLTIARRGVELGKNWHALPVSARQDFHAKAAKMNLPQRGKGKKAEKKRREKAKAQKAKLIARRRAVRLANAARAARIAAKATKAKNAKKAAKATAKK